MKPRLVGRIWSLFFRLYCLGFDPLCIFRVLNKEKKIAEVAKISSPSSKIGEQLPNNIDDRSSYIVVVIATTTPFNETRFNKATSSSSCKDS